MQLFLVHNEKSSNSSFQLKNVFWMQKDYQKSRETSKENIQRRQNPQQTPFTATWKLADERVKEFNREAKRESNGGERNFP